MNSLARQRMGGEMLNLVLPPIFGVSANSANAEMSLSVQRCACSVPHWPQV
jgi:hypothetical protein